MRDLILSKKVLVAVVFLVLLIGGGVGYKLYQDQNSAPKNEAQELIDAVAKIAELPQEVPTIATVTDKEKLKQYPFFSKAEIGDKVLLYNQAKKAYLYRPSNGKLVEVGPILLSDSVPEASSSGQLVAGEASSSAEVEDKFTLTLLNGTKAAGLATKTEAQLTPSIQNIEVKAKSNSKNDYLKTVVVVSNTKAKSVAEQIANALNATIEPLPQGEDKPSTDIAVFLGEDRI